MRRDGQQFPGLRTAGFTLLEMLVAAAIMGILAGAIYSVFASVIRLRARACEVIEHELPNAAALEVLRRDLTSLIVTSGTLTRSMLGTASRQGVTSNDMLEFYTNSATIRDRLDEPWGDCQRVMYYLAPPPTRANVKESGLELVREVDRNILAMTEAEPTVQRLLSGVESLEFYYLDQGAWLDEWDSSLYGEEPPQAVRVHIDFLAPDPKEAPPHPLDLICEVATWDEPTTETTSQ